MHFVDTVVYNLEARVPFISLYMDLSKAFECLDHEILMEKLSHYGLDEKSVSLIRSYLADRYQYLELKPEAIVLIRIIMLKTLSKIILIV